MNKSVVIIGAGFGGLAAAKALKHDDVNITLIDKANHHLFLPLLYQVATAVLAPSDVAVPIREILRQQQNARVIMGKVDKIDIAARQVHADNCKYDYDYLIIAAGLRNSYFNKNSWEEFAPGLRTLGDAIKIREKILFSLEKAERACTADESKKHLTFVVVGGGPTGVEVAGALAEITKSMLKDFKRLDTASVSIVLLEAFDRILSGFNPSLSARGKKALECLGVDVRLNVKINNINEDGVWTDAGCIETNNVIWSAGARSQPFVQAINSGTDEDGRVLVDSYCNMKGHPEVFVIGDTAVFMNSGKALPAVAQVAIQQGKYVSGVIKGELRGKTKKPFNYKNRGSIAIIGRYEAVLQSGKLEMSGYLAWLAWILLHVAVITPLRNRHMVLARWLWCCIIKRQSVALITGQTSFE